MSKSRLLQWILRAPPNHDVEKNSPRDMDPLSWGWTVENNILEPIKTDMAPAPSTL